MSVVKTSKTFPNVILANTFWKCFISSFSLPIQIFIPFVAFTKVLDLAQGLSIRTVITLLDKSVFKIMGKFQSHGQNMAQQIVTDCDMRHSIGIICLHMGQ